MSEQFEILEGSHGYTSTIYSIPGDPLRVCKSFNQDCLEHHFPTEREAYERFSTQNHPASILKYYGVHDTLSAGLILEHAQNGNLWQYHHHQRRSGHPSVIPELLYQWASQAAEALEFAHSLGVYNSDIHPINCFLDRDLNLKVGDWAGASIDGGKSYSTYRWPYRLIDADGKDVPRTTGITAITEIFALGSTMYFMVALEQPWPDLRESTDKELIKQRIRDKDFPDTTVLPVLGDVIMKCWLVKFKSMTEVRQAIESERHKRSSEDFFQERIPVVPVSELTKRKQPTSVSS